MAKSAKRSIPAGPRKVAPPHPGGNIGDIIKDAGLSLREAATMMGVSHNALSNLVKGAAAISPDMAWRLAAFMGNGETMAGAARFWYSLQAEYDLWLAGDRLKDAIKKVKPCPRDPADLPPNVA